MMVPKQLANTIEFMVERPAPAIGAVVAIVMAPPARWRKFPRKRRETRLQGMQATCRAKRPGARRIPFPRRFGLRRIGPLSEEFSRTARPGCGFPPAE